jgi:hypothetical protein
VARGGRGRGRHCEVKQKECIRERYASRVDPDQFIYEVGCGDKWVTEDVGDGCLVVSINRTLHSLAKDPVKLLVRHWLFLVSLVFLDSPIMVRALFSDAISPVEFSVRGFCWVVKAD